MSPGKRNGETCFGIREMSMIHISINGKNQAVPEGSTPSAVLTAGGYPTTHIAVAVNKRIIRREELDSFSLQEGDALIIIGAVKGG